MSGSAMEPGRPVVVLEKDLKKAAWKELFHIGRERGWILLDLRFSGNEVPRGLRPIGAFVNRLPDDPFVERLLGDGCHVIRLGTAAHRNDHLAPAVLPDLTRTGALAAEHFAERGFRHVAFIGHKPWGMYHRLYDGFRTRASELGCECHPFQWTTVPSHDAALATGARYRRRFKLFKNWLSAVPKPLGLLGINDGRACLYSRMCVDAGFEVPSEIGILGIGNDETVCETVYPSISSIAVDDRAIVEKAMGIFDQLSSGQTPGETTVLVPPKGLITRESTDVFAARTPGVAKAIRFMMDHYAEPIGIKEITHASGMSRARLFVTFNNDVGQPPGTILARIRVDKAKRMLRWTGEKVLTISQACGFGASINMYHQFKRLLGMSPAAYRKGRNE